MREISARDDFGASDAFGVLSTVLMTANKIFNFCKRQADCITTDTNGEDYSWDAVWKSKAIITDFGWAIRNANSLCSLALLCRKNKLGT
jgi:hypothetical protein